MKKINLNSVAFLVLGVFLLVTPALSQAIITSLVTAFYQNIDLLVWVNLAQNFWILNLLPKVVGAALVAGFVWKHLKTRFKCDLPKIKVQTTRLATYSLLFMLCASLFLFADVPISEAATTATTGYILDTPISEYDWLVGQYSNGNYYAIDGSNWDNLVGGVGSTAWSSYTSNSTALMEQVLAACTSGHVLLKDVEFDYDLTVPENVSVTERLNGLDRAFINVANSQGSPYTISVDSVHSGYYLAQDCMGRFIHDFISVDCSNVFKDVTVEGAKIFVKNGFYEVSGSVGVAGWDINENGVHVVGESWNTIFTIPNGFDLHVITVSADDVTIENIAVNGNYLHQTAAADGTAYGIMAWGASNVKILNCFVTECWSEGIGFLEGTNYSTIDSCTVDNTQTTGIVMYGKVGSTPATNTRYNSVVNCKISNCGLGAVLGNGVYFDGVDYCSADTIIINNVNDCGFEIRAGDVDSHGCVGTNIIVSNAGTIGIYLDGSVTNKLYSPVISNFYINNTGTTGIAFVYYVDNAVVTSGVINTTTEKGISMWNYVTNCQISDIIISDTTQSAIKIDGADCNSNSFDSIEIYNAGSYGAEVLSGTWNKFSNSKIENTENEAIYFTTNYISIINNEFINCDSPVIHDDSGSYADISNNRFYNLEQRAIYVVSGSFVTIDGNKIYGVPNTGKGITVLLVSNNVEIINNYITCSDGSTGISLYSDTTQDDGFVSNNVIIGAGTVTAINVVNAGVNYCTVIDNNIVNCSTGISDSGTNTTVKNNMINRTWTP